MDKALHHPDVEIIVNLTIPAAHVEVATAAVNAGKHWRLCVSGSATSALLGVSPLSQ